MNVDPVKLMHHFGNSIENAETSVKGQRQWNCPLHPDIDFSMTASDDACPLFRCVHPACRFKGDAIALVAVARNLKVKDAIDLFRPGGEFSDCLSEPLRVEEAEAYAESAYTQSSLKIYLEKCKQALRRTPERAGLVTGVSRATIRLMHPDVGLFLSQDGQEVPKCLSEFTKPKYRNSNLVLYPYTKDGEVTKIEVLDTKNPIFRYTAVVSHPHVGVFGEDAVGDARKVIVVERPETAAILYATNAKNSVKRIPIVSFQGYPLPESFHDVASVFVLSTVDAPVSTEFLLHTLSSQEITRGITPNIRVVHLQTKAEALSETDLRYVYNSGDRIMYELHDLLARRFTSMIHDGQEQRILELMAMEETPQLVRNLVKESAEIQLGKAGGFNGMKDATLSLIDLMTKAKYTPSADLTLANGRVVKRGPSEIVAVHMNGRRELLCNVGITVNAKVLSPDGGDTYVCSITHADDVPSIDVRLREKDLFSDKIQAAVIRAYSLKGFSPYVAFYTVNGYTWRDVFSKLSEHCPLSWELDRLGIDNASDINLPEAKIHANGTVSEQVKTMAIPDKALRMYSGIPFDDQSNTDPYEKLLSNCDNLFISAFVLGIMHVVYQMTYGLFKPEIVENRRMRHLFYVETEPGIWQIVFKQLAMLFSGEGFVASVSYAKPEETFKAYQGLGCLPVIAQIPAMGDKLASALDSSGVDVLGLLDTSSAVMSNGKTDATYVMPMNEREMNYNVLDARSVDQLRRSFLAFLVKFIKEAKIDMMYRTASMPCLAALDECFRIFGITPSDTPYGLVKSYFPGIGMTGVDLFCDLLHRLVVGGGGRITVSHDEPSPDTSFTRRGQHVFVMPDCVVVSNMVIDIVHQFCRGASNFDRSTLMEEMEARGMLAPQPERLRGIDWNRCWCISNRTWEDKIVRPPINLNEIVKDGTIKLEQLK